MNYPCPFVCNNKTIDGYCLFTACVNKKYNTTENINQYTAAKKLSTFSFDKWIGYDREKNLVLTKVDDGYNYVAPDKLNDDKHDIVLSNTYDENSIECRLANIIFKLNFEPVKFMFTACEKGKE